MIINRIYKHIATKQTITTNRLSPDKSLETSLKGSKSSLVKTYITDTYHVDSEHIFGFESQFDNVPRYILDICDDTINKIVQKAKAK